MYRRWGWLLLLALVHLVAPTGLFALSFDKVATITGVGETAPGNPCQAMLLVDVNGDPNIDFVTFDNNGAVLKIYLGDGTGHFGSANEIEVGEGPLAVATGDLLGRSRTDFVVVDENDSLTVLLQGDNPLTFDPHVISDFGQNLVGVAILPLNDDNLLDLAVLGLSDETDHLTVYLLRNEGDGNFVPFSPPTIEYMNGFDPFSIVSGNFSSSDGNGRLDLAVNFAVDSGTRLGDFVQTASGSFTPQNALTIGGFESELGPLVVADFDRNGTLDLATVDPAASDDQLFVLLLGQGNGTFRLQRTSSESVIEFNPNSLATADFNLDTYPDVITTHSEQLNSGQLSLLLSDVENGDYLGLKRDSDVRGLLMGSDTAEQAIVAGDVNKDGRPDMLVWMDSGEVRVLLNDAEVNGTATPTSSGPTATPTVTITAGGPSLTPTPTSAPATATSTPTPTPIPAAPYGLCDRSLSSGKPVAIVSGFFNSDRRPDLAVADPSGNRVLVILNDDELFSLTNCNQATRPVAAVGYATGTDPRALAMGDIDGDGIADLAVATSAGVSILTGSGSGTFTDGGTLVGGTDPRAVLVVDIDGNERQDIVTANAGSSDLVIFYAKEGGGFDPAKSIGLGRSATSVVAGQFDRDGLIDLAAGSGDIKVLLQAPETVDGFRGLSGFGSGTPITALVTGDFNRDGVLDFGVARGNAGAQGESETYQGTILSTGVPAYDRTAIVPVQNGPRAEAAAFLDRDGSLDLVVANRDSDTLSFALGNGSGGFPTRLIPFPVGEDPVSLAVADIDLDGQLDVVTANEGNGSTGSISILLSSRPPPTPTPQPTFTPTPTGTMTPLGSFTPTAAMTIGNTSTTTPTPTRTATFTATLTPTVTASRTPTKISLFSVSGPACNMNPESESTLLWPAGVFVVALLLRHRRSAALFLALLATTGLALSSAHAQGLPSYRACYAAVGSATTRGTIGDFDRNGTPDLAVLATPGDTGLVLLTNRDLFRQGRCSEAITRTTISPGSVPAAIATADFNANGILDLAVTSRSGVTILNGDGTGAFSASGPLPTPVPPTPGISDPKDIVTANLNRDVFPDLIVGDGTGKIILLYGNGSGGFATAAALTVQDSVVRVGAADFNHDGLTDVVALDESGTASVFLQDDDGSFARGATVVVGNSPVDLGIAVTNVAGGVFDFDRNDIPDFAFAHAGLVSAYVGVLPQSALTYERTSERNSGQPSGLAVNDFDNDTTLDVVAGDQNGNQILFFLGDGLGGLGTAIPFTIDPTLGGPPRGILSADVDGDGRPDVIVLGDSNNITFFLSSNPPFPTPSATATSTPVLTPTQTPMRTLTATPTPTLGSNDCCACSANMCTVPTDGACPEGCTPRYNSACIELSESSSACFANTPTPTPTQTPTPTSTSTPEQTQTPTSTQTPTPTQIPTLGPNDCCACPGNLCTLATDAACPTGCTPIFNSACSAGACIANTPTATATPTLGPNDCCICAGNMCSVPSASACPSGCTSQFDSACSTGACVRHTPTPTPTPTPTSTFTPTSTRTPTQTLTPTVTISMTPTETPIVAFALQGPGCAIGESSSVLPWLGGLALLRLLRRRRPA